MYRNILIPTDGSPLSTAAAHAGVALAAQCGAAVVGVHVAPEYQYPVNIEIVVPEYPTEDDYRAAMRRRAADYLDQVRAEADALGVRFHGITVLADNTADQIVHAAGQNGCDLIFIGSHGRSGLGQLLLGSTTHKILTSCKIPALVYRVPHGRGPGDAAQAAAPALRIRRILLPTDGSALSEAAAQHGIALAAAIGASVVGMHVMPEFHTFAYHTELLEDTRAMFEEESREYARKFLAAVESAARTAGVECLTTDVAHDHPWEAMIDTARELGCDLIVMASHGRKGVRSLLMGSETQKVLNHCAIPVIVYR